MSRRRAKTAALKVRISEELKRQIVALAERRGEGESVIVREALIHYLERHASRAGGLAAVLGPMSGDPYPETESQHAQAAEEPPTAAKHTPDPTAPRATAEQLAQIERDSLAAGRRELTKAAKRKAQPSTPPAPKKSATNPAGA
jgi:hypothetical protein